MDDTARVAHRDRIQKLLESVKVCEDFLEFRFKSGVTISVEK